MIKPFNELTDPEKFIYLLEWNQMQQAAIERLAARVRTLENQAGMAEESPARRDQ